MAEIVAELVHLRAERGQEGKSAWSVQTEGPRSAKAKGNNSEIVAVLIILRRPEQQVGQKKEQTSHKSYHSLHLKLF